MLKAPLVEDALELEALELKRRERKQERRGLSLAEDASILERFLPSEVGGEAPDPRVIRACRLLDRRLDRPLKVPQLAQEVGLGARRLRLLFKRDLGMTVKEVDLEIRLLVARRMLLRSFLRISEIAYAVGFSNASHFSRAFRKRFGMAAALLRKRERRPLSDPDAE